MWAGGAVAKKNKAKAAAGAKKKKDTITHGPDTLASFALLQLEPVRAVVSVASTSSTHPPNPHLLTPSNHPPAHPPHPQQPAKASAVEGAITALKEKKTWYSQQPRPPRKTAEERAAELAEKDKGREEEGKEGAGKEGGGKPKKEKKQPKEFKSCESWGLSWVGGWCVSYHVGGLADLRIASSPPPPPFFLGSKHNTAEDDFPALGAPIKA